MVGRKNNSGVGTKTRSQPCGNKQTIIVRILLVFLEKTDLALARDKETKNTAYRYRAVDFRTGIYT